MAQVDVADYALWIKHVHGDERLKQRLLSLRPDQTVNLRVNGAAGVWRKMSAYKTSGKDTPGLSPLCPMQAIWGTLYRQSKVSGGLLVDIELIEGASEARSPRAPEESWETAPESERAAAWEAYKALWAAGWRSDGAYPARDELHDRGAS